ncbi:hypothetical protein BDQ17DRAFT_482899 [Cyathus striatus]|nr:hypothetical protein BDQ17DRAFT_482899 [Cyathus striatus]
MLVPIRRIGCWSSGGWGGEDGRRAAGTLNAILFFDKRCLGREEPPPVTKLPLPISYTSSTPSSELPLSAILYQQHPSSTFPAQKHTFTQPVAPLDLHRYPTFSSARSVHSTLESVRLPGYLPSFSSTCAVLASGFERYVERRCGEGSSSDETRKGEDWRGGRLDLNLGES